MKKTITILLLFISLSLAFLVWGVDALLIPRIATNPTLAEWITKPIITDEQGIRRLGDCYAYKKQGISACYLKGTPAIRGAALARLYAPEVEQTQTTWNEIIQRRISNPVLRWGWFRLQTLRFRELKNIIPLEIQQEIKGMQMAGKQHTPTAKLNFRRLFYSQTYYDWAHDMAEPEALKGIALGMTSQLMKKKQTLLASNLDFPLGLELDKQQLVMQIDPPTGQAYISIGWPGMLGVVAGINEAGLGIVVLPVNSADRGHRGMPVSLLAQQVLQQAKNLAQAVDLITTTQVFVAENFVLGSGPEDSFVVVEKTPERTALRKMKGQAIVATNHFLKLRPDLESAKAAVPIHRTSIARWRRAREILPTPPNTLTMARAVQILRDRKKASGIPLGVGHASAINGLTAIHSVLFDLRNRTAWVAQSPHQLGAYIPFTIKSLPELKTDKTFPAARFLLSGKYDKYKEYLKGLQAAQQLHTNGEYQATLATLMEVKHLNPLDYRSYFLAGKALQALERQDEAIYNLRQAIKGYPAYLPEQQEIKSRLLKLQK